MPKSHAPYPPELKRRLVELMRAGRNAEELATKFEPSAQAIRNWVRQADRDDGRRHGDPLRAVRDLDRRGHRHLLLRAVVAEDVGNEDAKGVVASLCLVAVPSTVVSATSRGPYRRTSTLPLMRSTTS